MKGIIKPVYDFNTLSRTVNYLPYHAIVWQDHETTKVRVSILSYYIPAINESTTIYFTLSYHLHQQPHTNTASFRTITEQNPTKIYCECIPSHRHVCRQRKNFCFRIHDISSIIKQFLTKKLSYCSALYFLKAKTQLIRMQTIMHINLLDPDVQDNEILTLINTLYSNH